MKIYISIQNDNGSKFLEIDVSESITAKEVLELSEVKRFYQQEIDLLRVGINGEELDGKYKAHPINYRMSHGCLLYTSPSPRDQRGSRMPSSA